MTYISEKLLVNTALVLSFPRLEWLLILMLAWLTWLFGLSLPAANQQPTAAGLLRQSLRLSTGPSLSG